METSIIHIATIRGAREHNLKNIHLDGYRFTIVQATTNRIDLVRITRLPPAREGSRSDGRRRAQHFALYFSFGSA